MRVFDPTDHYDYAEIDEHCSCDLCSEWRVKLANLNNFKQDLPKKNCREKTCHPDLKGPCSDCRMALRARMVYLAALNRRDLYSECSYHASRMEPPIVGESFMDYISGIVMDRSARQDGWWTNKAPYLPIQFWITMFKRSLLSDIDVLEEVDLATAELPKAYISVAASGM